MDQEKIKKALIILEYLLKLASERDKRENPHSSGQDIWTYNIQQCIHLLKK
tara:strand:+ start:1733 stop:1885 length:153 start_codon:yes stop_codon:yes gene_type:complete